MATKPKGSYYRNKRSGANKFGYARQKGKTSYSATGATKRQAYGRLRRAWGRMGVNLPIPKIRCGYGGYKSPVLQTAADFLFKNTTNRGQLWR